MNFFESRGGDLYAEDIPVRRLAERFGTPLYIYSARTLERHFRVFQEALSDVRALVCYSVKANSNLAILELFAGMGGGFDVVSGGELFRALKAGADPSRIVYSGVGKTDEEIRYALTSGILMLNVESEEELARIDWIAREMGTRAPIALRVNPDVDPKTHPYVATGLKKSKFGVPIRHAPEIYERAARMGNVDPVGVDCHIGSQLTSTAPFVEAFEKVASLARRLLESGLALRYLDFGGGLGIRYRDEEPPEPRQYAEAILPEAKGLGLSLLFEPGRALVGNAGILVTRILYRKEGESKRFVIVDAGMNDLIRPALYDAYQEIVAVGPGPATPPETVADVVGPVCESGDFLARDRRVPDLPAGEWLAVLGAGAYGFAMSSNYNARPRPAEVLVRGSRARLVRARETYEDLIRGEGVEPGLGEAIP